MNLRDIPIGKRLLLSNFVMIAIPVAFTLVVSIAIFLGLHFGNINRAAAISFLWPESNGPTLSVQFELSRLCVRADWYNGGMGRLMQTSDHLEDQGLTVAISQQGRILYATEHTDPWATIGEAYRRSPGSGAALNWSDEGIAFHYTSPETGVAVAVVGPVQLRKHGGIWDLSSKNIVKVAFVVLAVLAVLVTIAVGLFLSRLLARQIVRPVEEMRNIAEDISRGNLDHPVVADGNDEISQTCRAFETMRKELKASREMRDRQKPQGAHRRHFPRPGDAPDPHRRLCQRLEGRHCRYGGKAPPLRRHDFGYVEDDDPPGADAVPLFQV